MERSLALAWTCLLGVGLSLVSPDFSITTSKTVPQPPHGLNCVFTCDMCDTSDTWSLVCSWKPGDTPATNYTLEVKRMVPNAQASDTYTCTVPYTRCRVDIGSSLRFNFCITVTAHSHSRDVPSKPRCQYGRIEVKLPPVSLMSVKSEGGSPRCLNVTWKHRKVVPLPVSAKEVENGDLQSQIEFKAQGQSDVQVKTVSVKSNTFEVCDFRPNTSYTVRLRHRYRGPESPWSLWSNDSTGRTAEEAPSAPPAFWRRVKQTDENGWRLVSLLWKPLLHFRVIFYHVTCQTERAQVLNDLGSCRNLQSTSCSLRLPPGPCSCSLTASTSAGVSTEARIWLLGAFETEPPPPSHITVSPLSDNSLDVRWKPPVDRPASGFVVEWFAVREKNSGAIHWEKLNSSCTALVITEGINPMERYNVSVKALYGERGAGANKTKQIYTREGAPSAGPTVHATRISGSTAELTWSPVPVELLRGFIRNYSITYSAVNQTTRSVFMSGDLQRYPLKLPLPGNYDISMQAHTDAGAGPHGPKTKVHISGGSEETWIVTYALVTVLLTSLALVLIALLAQSNIVKQKLCQDVPDPSNSSLATWTPKTAFESVKRPTMAEKTEIKYSEVILLADSEPLNSDPDKDLTYQSACNLQTYPSHPYTLLPVSDAQTPQNTRKLCIKSSTRAITTSNTELSSSVYSNILLSQAPKSPPAPAMFSSYLKFDNWQHSTVSVNDVKLRLGGDSEPSVSMWGSGATRSDSPPSHTTHELKTLPHFLRQHQSPFSFPDFSSISHSSVLLSHPAGVASPQHPFSQSLCNSVPSLQPDTFGRPGTPSDTMTTSLSPLPKSLFVDFSYCPLECDPYMAADVN